MGCFLGCFGGSKDPRRRKQRSKVIPRDQRHGIQNPLPANVLREQNTEVTLPTNLVLEIRDKPGEQLSLSNRKRVTFDSNVITYEAALVYESNDSLPKSHKVRETENAENRGEPDLSNSISEDDSVTSSVGSYPPNHRYQNCRDSDDEAEEYGDSCLDDEDDDKEKDEYVDDDEDNDGRFRGNEIWSKSVLTESMQWKAGASSAQVIMGEGESPLKMNCLTEQGTKVLGPKGGYVRDRSTYIHPVLNPVENLTQWKAVKAKGKANLKSQKENFTADMEAPRMSFSFEPTFKQSSPSSKKRLDHSKDQSQEIAVDASLSNWLVSQSTPNKKNSSSGAETITSETIMSQSSNSIKSLEDRPILGALTVEELRQFSASSSPRKSPSRSPDEMPIIGTVGTYWNHQRSAKDSGSASSFKGIPNTTSKYREDKRVNWHSTPFETRLERALNRGVSEAQ